MRILIGYNGTEAAKTAIADLEMAGLPDETEALIMTVAEICARPDNPEEARRLASEALELMRNRFPTWLIAAETANGSAGRELLAKAETFHPDMIVVGEGRQSNRDHSMFLGQVSNLVLTEAECTVRISREHEHVTDRAPQLLIGYDGSPGAEAAVNLIAQRSWPTGTTATLLAVADSGVVGSIGRFVPQMKDAVIETKFVSQWGHTLAAEALATLTEAGIKSSVEIVMGNPKTTIVERADSLNADCIFVGPHCAGNSFERFLLGSVSSTVAARAHCTVEVVRASHP
ncbi:MAG: universal stress protein, partial [Pyrinomonadaceae bacterium]